MKYLPGRHNRIYYLLEELKDFIASRVKTNEASLDPQNPRDFIDCFLIKMHQVPLPLPQRFPLSSSIPNTCNSFVNMLETKKKTQAFFHLVYFFL